MASLPPIQIASVKVMRSFDYCHFEITLSSSDLSYFTDDSGVDQLRKRAARLVDKAVEQYKIAKRNAELILGDEVQPWQRTEAEKIRATPEDQRSVRDKAALKAFDDRTHRNRRRYDYEDDWQEPDYEDSEDD